MRTYVAVALAIMIVGGWALLPSTARACSCALSGTPEQEREQSASVFAGRVSEIAGPNRDGVGSTGDSVRVTFEVSDVWKGPPVSPITLETAASSASCGYEFQPDVEYLVYAREVDGELIGSLCSRTTPLERAGADMEALGEATPAVAAATPEPSASPTPSAGPTPAIPRRTAVVGGTFAGVITLLLLIAGVWAWRSNRA